MQISHRRDLGVGFVPARVAGTCHRNPASQTAAGRKLHQGSTARFLCRMRWPEVRASEKHHFSPGGPWKALKAPEVGGPWRQRPSCPIGLHKMMAHAYRKQMDYGGPWKALKAPEVGGPWKQRPFCSVGLHKMMAHAYRKQVDL